MAVHKEESYWDFGIVDLNGTHFTMLHRAGTRNVQVKLVGQ